MFFFFFFEDDNPNTCVVKNPTILAIAKKHNKLPTQVALRWGLQRRGLSLTGSGASMICF
jgi:diketogulonate reductase-like aldo/keto reductase